MRSRDAGLARRGRPTLLPVAFLAAFAGCVSDVQIGTDSDFAKAKREFLLGNSAEAKRLLAASGTASDPEDQDFAEARLMQGFILLKEGDGAGARRALEAAFEASDEPQIRAQALFGIGRALAHDERYAEAEQRFTDLARQFPGGVREDERLWQVALCRTRRGDFKGAGLALATLKRSFPDSPRAAEGGAVARAGASGQGAFAVQCGIFASRTGADALARRISARGFSASVQEETRGERTWWAVRVGGFSTFASAKAACSKIEAAGFDGFIVP